MAYVAGNIDERAFYPFSSDPDVEPPIVIQRSSKWSFTNEAHVEKVSVQCYPLGSDHVLSVTLTGEVVLTKEHLDTVVNQNAELLTTIKHIVGGDSK